MNIHFRIFVILLVIFDLACQQNKITKNEFPEKKLKEAPLYKFIPARQSILPGGLLAERYQKKIYNLYLGTDLKELKNIYKETHDPWYAEPEFPGCVHTAGTLLYAVSGNELIPDRNNEVLDVVFAGQRENGYLCKCHAGLEFDYAISVWNQNFMIKGLITEYEAAGNQKALEAAKNTGEI
jgi:hypothetical protein